jgi:hypothetical protein
MHTRNGQDAREARRNSAAQRQAERDARTDQQQVDKLRRAGHGHCKEVLRLKMRMQV